MPTVSSAICWPCLAAVMPNRIFCARRRSRAQKARLFELRAASSLARLWRDQGGREEALTTLKHVYGWFTEGFDMPDLVDARLLLESLKPATDVAKVESCGRARSDRSATARGSC